MPTIRNPQTDVSNADHIIDGDWEFDKKLTYTSTLSFSNDNEIVDKIYVDARAGGGVDEFNIYYIGKHGNDTTNVGVNIGQAFLTIQKGIDEAEAQTPTPTDQYVVRVNDGGSYDSFTLASKPYIQVIAEGAQFQTTGASAFIIGDNNTVNFDKGTFVVGSGTFLEKEGSGESYLNGNEISDSSVTTAIKVNSGTLYANISNIDITASNTAFSVSTNTTLEFEGQDVTGKIDIGVDGYAAISVQNQTGDINVGSGGILNLNINGDFNGNITAAANSVVRILLIDRSAYTDNIDEDADVSIDYIGHRLDQHTNLLIGADYEINPRQETPSGVISAVNDDSYVADNTIYLSDGNGITDISKGDNDNLKMTVATVNKQFGILIPVENKDSLEVIGDVASISLRAAWTSGNTHPLRMALLSWDSTEDTITTDVVSSWGLTPTLVANWTYENTSTDLTFSSLNVYETFKIENIPVDTVNTNNIAIFVWVADTIILNGDVLQISNIRCNKGKVVEDFACRSFTEEILLCKRFYDKSYNLNTAPATATYTSCLNDSKGDADTSHPYFGANVRYRTSMLKTPTVHPYSVNDGTIDTIYDEFVSSNRLAYGLNIGTEGCQIGLTHPPSEGVLASYHWVADARF